MIPTGRASARLRVVLLASIFSFSTFAVQAAPTSLPLPRPEALKPATANAGFCADTPSFTGHMTSSSGSTAVLASTTTGVVYGYISNVDGAWSCTAYYRYSSLTWNTTATLGTFDWGNLINSTGVACNWVVGSTDYLKANSTADCADTDAEYAMAVSLNVQQVYHNNAAHTAPGHFSYAHSDCGTYYGGETVKTGQSYAGTDTGNRPGSNCDPIVLDNTSTAQNLTYDATPPSGSISIQGGAAYWYTPSVTLNLSATDNLSGVSQMRFSNDNVNWSGWIAYGTSSAWTLAGGEGTKTVYAQYRDALNNPSGSVSDTIVLDTLDPTLDFSTPNEFSTAIQSSTSYSVGWVESGTGSPILSRELEQWSGSIGTPGTCDDAAFAFQTSSGAASPVNVTGLVGGNCYVWIQTITDSAGNQTTVESGAVLVDTTAGLPDPPDVDATGTGVYQPTTNGTVYFRPAAASSISLTSDAFDDESDLGYVRFQNLTGANLTPTPALPNNDTVPPYTQSIGFNGSSASGSIGVLSHNNANLDSSIRTVTLTADSAAPTADFATPNEATTTVQPSDAVSVSWTESEVIPAGIDSTSLKRQSATYSAGACGAFADDLAFAAVPDAPSPYPDDGLLVNTCYRWVLTMTDVIGNSGASTSGTIVRETTANLGSQPQHTFESFDLGSGDGLAVNVATGNLVLTNPVFELPIRGASVGLSLTYNHHDPSNVGMGPGWRLDAFRRLALNGDGTVTITDADGSRHTFTAPVTVGTVTTYTRPATMYATLVKDTALTANEFVLTYRDQAKDKFDISGSEGLLVREEDRFGNGVTVAYTTSTNRISTITDTAAGRVINLTWDGSNRLAQVQDWAWIDASGVVQTTNSGARRTYRFFYDGSGRLAGWADPLNTSGTCPTGGSHLTCIAYPTNGLDISKTQTVTTAGASALSTTTRTVTSKVVFAGSNVAAVKDAQQVQDAGTGTTFTWETPTKIWVERPATNPIATGYGLLAQNDPYARIASVWRDYPEGPAQIEQRTAWDATFPTEPATVTDNFGALLGTPARTVTTTYVPNSLGLVLKVVEPLTASTNRWTEYVYNANNDVTQKTVSQDGSGSLRTISRSCYSTQSLSCPTTETGLTLVRQIENWVSSGPQDDDTNVATDYTYDSFGRQTRVTRHNRAPDGSVRDDRVDALFYDATNLGNLDKSITNFIDGVVTNGTLDTTPGTDSVRTDLTSVHTYDTAGNRVSSADPRRAIGLAIPASTTYTFNPTDDAHVRDAATTTNYGSDTTLQVRGTGGAAGAYEPYLKFTVTGLVGTVTGVTLRLQNSATANRNGRNVCVFRVPTTTWTEGAITWATKPASDATSLACVVGDQAAGPIDYAVTAAVPGPGIYAFRLTNDTAFEVIYGSKEHLTLADPQLRVTVSYGPLAADDWITRWTYDALGQRLTEKTPKTFGLSDQKTATTTYDELGDARQAVDFNGLLTTGTEFDRAGHTTKTFEDTDAGGATAPAVTSITTYDPAGLAATVKDRNQAASSALGYTQNEYDSLGRLELVTNAAGSTPDVASDTLTGYDALDRKTLQSYGGLDTVTTFDLGSRTLSTDDDFTCATSTYDYRGLALTVTSGLAGGTCASAANTRTVTNSFDGLGRQFRAEVTAGTGTGDRTQDATLDSVGNGLTAASRKGGVITTTTFTVNKLDDVVIEVRPDGSTSKSTIDASGNTADKCYWKPTISVGDCQVVGTPAWTNPPSQSTSTSYDARDQRIQLVDGLTNGITTYDPDHNYQPAAVYLPTSSGREFQTLYRYDSRHRVSQGSGGEPGIEHRLCVLSNPATHACSSTTAAGSDTYAYDNNDNRTTVNESNGAASSDRRYCYDALDQLVFRNTAAACSSSAKDEANTYDDAANRLTATVGSTTTNFAYTVDGQLCDVEVAPTTASCTGGNITYDTAGRTATWNGWTFAYDSQGRMLSACKSPTCAAGFDKVEFAYDGENHRTKLTTTNAAGAVATRDFRYQGEAIVEEKLTDAGHPSGTVVRNYITDDSGATVKLVVPAGESDAGTYLVTWSGHGDALALWRQNADGTTTLANSFTYDTWGKPTTSVHNSIGDLGFRFLYVGEFDVQWDDAFGLGLTYMHARHYSPALGRFLQPDPDGSEANLYAYTANNPVTEMDPDGSCFILCAIVNAVVDTAIYLATTDSKDWSIQGAGTAAVTGAVTGFLGVGLLSKVTKVGGFALKVISKVPKAGRILQRGVSRISQRSTGSCVVVLRCAPNSTVSQVAEMRQKAADLDRLARAGSLTKTAVVKSGRSATGGFRRLNRSPGFDWDHIHELQMGGRDIISNLRRVSSRVNRSAGAQISRQLRNVPYGTRISRVMFDPRF